MCAPQSLRLAGIRDHLGSTLAMLREVRRRADDFDIIHFHVDLLPQALFHDLAHKCLVTLHGRLDLPDTLPLYKAYPEMPLVSISNAQRRPMPAECQLARHHPAWTCFACLSVQPGRRELFGFSRTHFTEKRPDRAIEIAKRAGIPLKLAAKVDAVDLEYFETEIEPLLDHPLIEFIGEINETQKCEFLGKARALLFPIDWPEPFELVMIEAMSAGTPVIAWPNGSVPEVVTEGVSGRIVNSIESAVEAVQQAAYMDRRKVRAEFEKRFTAARMARAYVAAYRSLLARVPATTRLPEVAMPAVAAREVSPLAWERIAKQGGGQVLNPAG